jgi:hypothetical protein
VKLYDIHRYTGRISRRVEEEEEELYLGISDSIGLIDPIFRGAGGVD